jgi:hypothetical protein
MRIKKARHRLSEKKKTQQTNKQPKTKKIKENYRSGE